MLQRERERERGRERGGGVGGMRLYEKKEMLISFADQRFMQDHNSTPVHSRSPPPPSAAHTQCRDCCELAPYQGACGPPGLATQPSEGGKGSKCSNKKNGGKWEEKERLHRKWISNIMEHCKSPPHSLPCLFFYFPSPDPLSLCNTFSLPLSVSHLLSLPLSLF